MLSAFPLNAVTLGNNLMSACFGAAAGAGADADADTGAGAAGADADAGSEAEALVGAPAVTAASAPATPPLRRIAFRLIAAVPPLFAGALSTYFGVSLRGRSYTTSPPSPLPLSPVAPARPAARRSTSARSCSSRA